MTILAAGCAGPSNSDRQARIEAAEQPLSDDPAIRARVAEVEAAAAREQREAVIDEIELRVGGEHDDENRTRVTARIPVTSPGELRRRREVLQADTEVAVSRLEETSLRRRAELCFPSVAALVQGTHASIYQAYAERRKALLEWNREWHQSGMIDELRAAKFDLESRVKLATREPARAPMLEVVLPVLPEIEAKPVGLVQTASLLRETIRHHHPSVALRRATAERYRALSERARALGRPRIKFIDLSYEHQSGTGGNHGVGGQVAFEVPLGARKRASVARYQALVRQEENEERQVLDEQMRRSIDALGELDDFETRAGQWDELRQLARTSEEIADRWWRERLTQPSQVAALLDQAYSARIAVLDARERAGIASCTLLAMTGVPLEEWPRE
jgi:hypothetical protein